MKVLSFGGGVQTTALAVMIVKGEVETDVMVFADTGGEHPKTYEHLALLQTWLKGHGREFVTVKSPEQPLYDYVWDRSTVIPVRVGHNEGLGRRQCTRQWKVTPILKYAKSLTEERPIIMQLGISYDEIHRMKDSPDKGIVREWPLIDLMLTREDCRKIIADAGLPEAPKSACYFCPLLPASTFRSLAANEPELFEKAAALEDQMNLREIGKGRDKRVYLTPSGRPVRELANGQMTLMDQFLDGKAEECEGTCFV